MLLWHSSTSISLGQSYKSLTQIPLLQILTLPGMEFKSFFTELDLDVVPQKSIFIYWRDTILPQKC